MERTPAGLPARAHGSRVPGDAPRTRLNAPGDTSNATVQNGLPTEAAPAGPPPDWGRLPLGLLSQANAFLAPPDLAAAGKVSGAWREGVNETRRQMLRQHYFGTARSARGLTPEDHARDDLRDYLDSVPDHELGLPGPQSVIARSGCWWKEVAANRQLPGLKQEPPREPSVTPGQLRALFCEAHPDVALNSPSGSHQDNQLRVILGMESGLTFTGQVVMDAESRKRISDGHINYGLLYDDLRVFHLNGGEVLAFHRQEVGPDTILLPLSPALPNVVGPVREVAGASGGKLILLQGTGGRLAAAVIHRPAGEYVPGAWLHRSAWPWGDARVTRLFPRTRLVQIEDGRCFYLEISRKADGSPLRINPWPLELPPGVHIVGAPTPTIVLLSDGTVRALGPVDRARGVVPLTDVVGKDVEMLNNPKIHFHYLQVYHVELWIAIGQSRTDQDDWLLLVNGQPVALPHPWSPKDIVGVHWMSPELVFDLGNGDLFCHGGQYGEGVSRTSEGLKELGFPGAADRMAMVHEDPVGAVVKHSHEAQASSHAEGESRPAPRDLTGDVKRAFKKRANMKYSTADLKGARWVSLKGLGPDHDRICRESNLHVWPAARKERRVVNDVMTSFLVCESDSFIPALREHVAKQHRHALAKNTYEIPKNLLQPTN